GVEAIGDVLHAVLGEPALGGDHRVDDRLHADLGRGLEHHLVGRGGDGAVRGPQLVREQRGVTGGGGQARGVQGGAELVGAAHEVAGVEVLQADLRERVGGAVHVGGELRGQRVQLDGGEGQCHG